MEFRKCVLLIFFQCSLVWSAADYGARNSNKDSLCRSGEEAFEVDKVCYLACVVNANKPNKHVAYTPEDDGTPCGSNSVCMAGKCVAHGQGFTIRHEDRVQDKDHLCDPMESAYEAQDVECQLVCQLKVNDLLNKYNYIAGEDDIPCGGGDKVCSQGFCVDDSGRVADRDGLCPGQKAYISKQDCTVSCRGGGKAGKSVVDEDGAKCSKGWCFNGKCAQCNFRANTDKIINIPCPLQPGDYINLKSKYWAKEGERFSFSLEDGNGRMVHLHFDIRNHFTGGRNNDENQKVVLLAHRPRHEGWLEINEIRHTTPYPFKEGEPFDLVFQVGKDAYKIYYNEQLLWNFQFQLPLSSNIRRVSWSGNGDVFCADIYQGGRTCQPWEWSIGARIPDKDGLCSSDEKAYDTDKDCKINCRNSRNIQQGRELNDKNFSWCDLFNFCWDGECKDCKKFLESEKQVLLGCPLAAGNWVKVKGKVLANQGQRFGFYFEQNANGHSDYVHFHFDIRNQFGNMSPNKLNKIVIMNDKQPGKIWDLETEVVHTEFYPFEPGTEFELLFEVKEDRYEILHNGQHKWKFPFREPLDARVNRISWAGDGEVDCIEVYQGDSCPGINCCR